MPLDPVPQSWIDEAAVALRAGRAVRCWRCAVTVDADKVLVPGRCTAPGRVPDPCPLNAAGLIAAKQKAA